MSTAARHLDWATTAPRCTRSIGHVSSLINDEAYRTLLKGGPVVRKSVPYDRLPSPDERQPVLTELRRRKMARSPHAYQRGTATYFYEWLDGRPAGTLPDEPAVWI